MDAAEKNEIVQELRKRILHLEGYRADRHGKELHFGLGPIERAFPNKTFPVGTVHELISANGPAASATNGFICGMVRTLMESDRPCLWIGAGTIFPPALTSFGIQPHKVIFIDLKREKEILWTVEEALKCDAVAAVVGEIRNISFAESRRLQLAVEKSNITGFIHRHRPQSENTLACVARWKIKPLPGETDERFPGVSHPKWLVDLVRVRNGSPGTWQVEWRKGRFRTITEERMAQLHNVPLKKTGGSYA